MSESTLEERDPISDEAFRALLDWYMVSDPWPLDERSHGVVFGFLTAEAHKRGFGSWDEAYHEFEVKND